MYYFLESRPSNSQATFQKIGAREARYFCRRCGTTLRKAKRAYFRRSALENILCSVQLTIDGYPIVKLLLAFD